jgi:maltose alpha-D-glucosyltransferase / alpha-amylase
VALDRATVDRPEDRGRLFASLSAWRAETSRAFLDAYRDAIRGTSSWPDDDAAAGALIQLFSFEKVLYELRYELANRLDWVRIPLAGVLEQIVADRTV